MQISRRVTNGLAWAGLILVVGIPSADIISAQVMGEGPTERAAVVGKPLVLDTAEKPRLNEVVTEKAAAAAPVPQTASEPVQVAEAGADPVEQYIQSGRKLPSYILDDGASATAAAQPAQAVEGDLVPATQAPAVGTAAAPDGGAVASPATDRVETAAIDPTQKVAPVPMPLSMRPAPMQAATTSPTLIIPEDERTANLPAIMPDNDFPVVPPADVEPAGDIVTADDLEGWESGPLSEFLARRNGGSYEPDYDPDGFFLDEAPQSSVTYRRRELPPDIVYVYPLD